MLMLVLRLAGRMKATAVEAPPDTAGAEPIDAVRFRSFRSCAALAGDTTGEPVLGEPPLCTAPPILVFGIARFTSTCTAHVHVQ